MNPPDPKTPSDAEWLRNLAHFMHVNGHPFDGDELAAIADRIESLTRRLEEAEKKWHDAVELNRLYHDTRHDTRNFAKNAQQQRDDWQKESSELEAKLTALRSAAEGAMKALELANVTDDKFNDKNADFIESALAALRAELDQADSNASNSPTASRESQG